jgi:hypothetical protein
MEKSDFLELLDAMGITSRQIETMAMSTNFLLRKSAVTPADLLYALCCEATMGTVSFNDAAGKIDAAASISVSRQAIAKKMGKESCSRFIMKILALVIVSKIDKHGSGILRVAGKFKRILVQDSTIISLPARLFKSFSGVSNGYSSVCNARIQCVYDLVSESFIAFSIDPYSKNDLVAAPELVLQQGDLVLRDRGYLTYDEIKRHNEAAADCIFRYKQGMPFFQPGTGAKLDLLALLKSEGKLDIIVTMGDKEHTRVRVVAFAVSEEVANMRRMKAKKENKKKPDEDYLAMLSWSIYITTILPEVANDEFVYKTYGLRWRIEIIFKSWKSNMGFSKMHNVSKRQLSLILYARFIMIIICIQYIFSPARMKILKHIGKELSMIKVVRYLMKNQSKLIQCVNEIKEGQNKLCCHLKAMARYCTYEKRTRTNFEKDFEVIIWP